MKTKPTLILLIFLMASCQNYQVPKFKQIDTSKSKKNKPAPQELKTEKTISGDTNLTRQILGIWAAKDDLNAAFEINNHDFYYPDQSSNYNYTIFKDSLVIDYKNYRDTFKVETKGIDTLILSNKSDGRNVFHRFKK